LKKTAAELNNINGAADISELINQLTGEKWCWLMYSLVWKILGFSFMFLLKGVGFNVNFHFDISLGRNMSVEHLYSVRARMYTHLWMMFCFIFNHVLPNILL
jgi:ammonia channel protein AmtB